MPNSNIKVIYNGNGVAKEFQIPFSFLEKEHIKVIRIDLGGEEHLLTKDYFVDSTGKIVHYPGYAIGEEPPQAEQPQILPTGEKLLIYRSTPKTQNTDLPRQEILSAIEAMNDRSIMCIQEMSEELGRSIKPPISSALSGEFPSPVILGASLAISEDGKSLRYGANPDGIAYSVTTANEAKQTANEAKETAEGIAGTANSALTIANKAKETAEGAKATAEGIAGTADNALTVANQANENIQTAIDAADEATQKLEESKVTTYTSEDAGKSFVVNCAGTGTEWQFVSGVPVGTIIAWGGLTPPAGYLECTGQLLNRVIYVGLFSAIGTVWGTTASDNFKLPDFKSAARFLRSRGDGLEVGMTQEDAIRNITGASGVIGSTEYSQSGSGAGAMKQINGGNSLCNSVTNVPSPSIVFDASLVVPTADENRPKNAVVMYCIKVVDEYINPAQVDIEPLAQQLVNKPNREEIKEIAETRLWVSGEYTPIANQATKVSHELAGIDPLKCRCDVMLVCKVPEHGYSIGDTAIGWYGVMHNGSGYLCTTTVPLLTKNQIQYNTIPNQLFASAKTSGAQVGLTHANWRYVFRIWY